MLISQAGAKPHKWRPRDLSVRPSTQEILVMRVARVPPLPKLESRRDHSAARDRPPEDATELDSARRIEYRSHSEPVAVHPARSCGPRRRGKRAGHMSSPPAYIRRFPPATNCKAVHDTRAPGSIEADAVASHAEPRPGCLPSGSCIT